MPKQCLFSQRVDAAESRGPQAVPSQDSLEKANGAPPLAVLNPSGGCTGAALATFLKANFRNTEESYLRRPALPLAGPQPCLRATAENCGTQASWGLWHLGAPDTSVQPRHWQEATLPTSASALKAAWSIEIPSNPWASSLRSQLKRYFP